MTTRAACADCKRLWKEYTEALHGQLEALRESHDHAAKEDNLALMKAEWEERASERKRNKARKALTEHQVTHLVRELEKQPVRAGLSKRK